MAGKPILFSGPMISALLDGRKSQTRRALAPQPYDFITGGHRYWNASGVVSGRICVSDRALLDLHRKPKPGDMLYVCEEHYRYGHWEASENARTKRGRQKWQFVEDSPEIRFEAPEVFRKGRHHNDPSTPAWHKRLGRFMFRKHSRLTLVITDVRIMRLRDISEGDAVSEGAPLDPNHRDTSGDGTNPHMVAVNAWTRISPVAWFHRLWDQINGDGAWDKNPWVAAYTFRVIKSNIDRVAS
ncbi:hypothetical protein GOZ80_06005 [Agrobacterium vitis]|uniref:hypothetical protein n=1 Tax=Agrobacterium vitis TaxID=373 RepID=UPI0012E93F3B|nr:hypothetical protein [Agrobacterium vitis]MVA91573.1 hypothetical protein [Agrobacterium vitis]MVB00522.1 hypothetical protein [Agrobacterium vitis]